MNTVLHVNKVYTLEPSTLQGNYLNKNVCTITAVSTTKRRLIIILYMHTKTEI